MFPNTLTADLSTVISQRILKDRVCPDAWIRAFGKTYPVHRSILISQSDYLERKLTAYFEGLGSGVQAASIGVPPAAAQYAQTEQQACTSPPDLQMLDASEHDTASAAELVVAGAGSFKILFGDDITQWGFEFAIEYMYRNPDICLSMDTVFDVLNAAHFLLVPALPDLAAKFVCCHLTKDNCTTILQYVRSHSETAAAGTLRKLCLRFAALNIPSQLIGWATILNELTDDELCAIVTSSELAVASEFERYQLAKKIADMVQTAQPSRAGVLQPLLLTCVEYSYLTPHQLQTVLSEGLVDEALLGRAALLRTVFSEHLKSCPVGGQELPVATALAKLLNNLRRPFMFHMACTKLELQAATSYGSAKNSKVLPGGLNDSSWNLKVYLDDAGFVSCYVQREKVDDPRPEAKCEYGMTVMVSVPVTGSLEVAHCARSQSVFSPSSSAWGKRKFFDLQDIPDGGIVHFFGHGRPVTVVQDAALN